MQRKILLIIISVLILNLSIIGLTYAFMCPQVEKKEEKSNITINACAKIQLKDNGSTINLENSYPMDDEKGLETKPYEFTITSTCEDYVGFNLYLTSLNDNQIEDSNIHYAITSKSKDILSEGILSNQESGVKDFNSEELNELDIGINGTHKNIYKVYSNNLPLQSESNYQLYLWLDKDASNETMGKSFKVGLSVKYFNRDETYADNCDESLATCEIAQKVYENNTLFYNDTNLKNGAEDLSYRFSGASDKVNNYVCLDGITESGICETDDDLYRIIGLFKNENGNYEMKLIKAQGATVTELGDGEVEDGAYYGKYTHGSLYYKGTNLDNLVTYYWNSSLGTDSNENNVNMWQYSNLNKENLNKFYYNYITKRATYLENHIANHEWMVGGTYNTGYNTVNAKEAYNNELGTNKTKNTDKRCYTQGDTSTAQECNGEYDLIYPAHIGLMYLSDYMYATTQNSWTISGNSYSNETVRNNNWLYIGMNEWLISRVSSYGTGTLDVDSYGNVNNYRIVGNAAVRPSFYLTSDAKIKEGEGTKEEPYRLTFD